MGSCDLGEYGDVRGPIGKCMYYIVDMGWMGISGRYGSGKSL